MIGYWKFRQSWALAIVALLTAGPFSLAWAADGDLDVLFGTNGIVSTPISSRALAVQSDGRIIVAGALNADFALARYTADGWLDLSFGKGGIVQTDLGGNESARTVEVLQDGGILVGGSGLVRYNADGSLDEHFGNGGIVRNVEADDISVRPDGRIMVVGVGSRRVTHLNSQGGVESTSGLPEIIPCANPPMNCPFGPGGIADAQIMPSGQIATAGSILNAGRPTFFVARYNEDGTPDMSFGTKGGAPTWIGYEWEYAGAVAVQDDGKIVAVGYTEAVLYPPLQFFWTFAVGRFNSDGTRDRTLGGPMTVPPCQSGTLCLASAATAVTVQRDGKVIVAGTSQRTLGSNEVNLALVRFRSSGALDESFGTDGIVITDVIRGTGVVQVQPDGKILVTDGRLLVRYLGTSTEDVDPPVIDCEEPDGIWHPANVALSCTATDSGSGLAHAEEDTHFALRTNVGFGEEWPNAFTDSRQICDNRDHCATAGPIGGNMIDRRAPTVAVTNPLAGSTITLGQPMDADYACFDGGSGVQSCIGTVARGTAVNTSTVGLQSFEVTGVDNVSNSTHATSPYTVSYGICPRYNSHPRNSGSTLPITLQLCNASGANVSSAAIAVNAQRVVLLSSGNEVDVERPRQMHSTLDFRFSEGQYILNLSLQGFATGTYGLELKAGNDPTIHTVRFEVK